MADEEPESPPAAQPATDDKVPVAIPKQKNSKGQDDDDLDYFGGQQKCGENVVKAFLPYRILLTIFGRWPMTKVTNPDGSYTYTLKWYKPLGLYFLITFVYYLYFALAGGYNLALVLLHLTNRTETENLRLSGSPGNISYEYAFKNSTFIKEVGRVELSKLREGWVVQRHLALGISLWTNVILCIITSINVIYKHKYMANYFSFWTRAVQTMHMDAAKGVAKHSWIFVGMYFTVIVILALMAIAKFTATATGAPVLTAIYLFKFFNPNMLTETSMDLNTFPEAKPGVFKLYQILGGIGFVYILVGSKAYILLFLYKCKLLRNAFASWNGRVYAAILRGGDFTQTKEGRTTFTLLFKDHCVLLDLLEGTNRFFSGVLESYFMLQTGALCFELYVVLRTAKYGHQQDTAVMQGFFVRQYDFIPSLLIFVLNSSIIYAVSKSAALVGEEAIAGLEVIRRKTMLGRKTDEELYFMLSMYTSYISYRRIEVSAGGYFYVNKEFVITLVSTIFSYFIILYQFQPYLDPSAPGSRTNTSADPDVYLKREAIGSFFQYLENSKPCNWRSTTDLQC